VLPEIAEIVLIQEAFIDAKVQVGQLDFPCIVAGEPAKPWHGVVLLADAKAMNMEVRPVEADLQRRREDRPGVLSDLTTKRRQSIGWIPRIQTWKQ
jgi:hypothetical protein